MFQTELRLAVLPLVALCCVSALGASDARYLGATALEIQPEHSYNGYDFTIQAALSLRGFDVTVAQPEALVDAAALRQYDLVVTDLRRHFTPEQVAGLKAYLKSGGAMYGNWGGPMGCRELLRICGVTRAYSVYIKALTLTNSPLTGGQGELRWSFPAFAGNERLGGKGREMVAFDRTDGLEVAHDAQGRCLGTLRKEGAGRCALLGFCPSNYRFITSDSKQAGEVLDRLLAWLLPHGIRPHPLPPTIQLCLPRHTKVSKVWLDGRALPTPVVHTLGSLTTVTVPVRSLAEGRSAELKVACELPAVTRHIETWLHDPVASSFTCFDPAGAADFFATLHVRAVQPLLRYQGGSICYLHGIPGDKPRKRFADYHGDLLADYVKACHARGIKVIGGLYLDWKRFKVQLADVPPRVGKNRQVPPRRLGQPVCPLDHRVWQHNLELIRNLLDHYPELDGLILDDNFEFDRKPCYCPNCLAKFAAWCAQQPGHPKPQPDGELWKEFWVQQKLDFCRRVHELCAAHGKPVGGWTAQRGPAAFPGVFDFAGDMVYSVPPSSVAALWPLVGDFPVVTLLWGMDRQPSAIASDVTQAIRAGSYQVGFWLAYAKVDGATDNPWSLGTRPRSHFSMTPGTLTAVEHAFAGVEQTWREYYREHLVLGDARFVVTQATLTPRLLTVTVKRLARPSPERIVGEVDLSGLSAAKR